MFVVITTFLWINSCSVIYYKYRAGLILKKNVRLAYLPFSSRGEGGVGGSTAEGRMGEGSAEGWVREGRATCRFISDLLIKGAYLFLGQIL